LVSTAEQAAQALRRVGQREFSERVRAAYQSRCCFPDCKIVDYAFLVGAHIARWADAPDLRGNIANGLCFCLFHDRAFEIGLFTLDEEQRIWVNKVQAEETEWGKTLLRHYGALIRPGDVQPSVEALRWHWHRIGVDPRA